MHGCIFSTASLKDKIFLFLVISLEWKKKSFFGSERETWILGPENYSKTLKRCWRQFNLSFER